MEKIGRELMSRGSRTLFYTSSGRGRYPGLSFSFCLIMHILYDDFDLVLLVLCQSCVYPFFLFYAFFLHFTFLKQRSDVTRFGSHQKLR